MDFVMDRSWDMAIYCEQNQGPDNYYKQKQIY